GAVYSDTGEVIQFDVSNRLKVVLEVIEEASNKVLVFVPFTHTIELLKEFLDKNKISSQIISGKVTLNKRSEIFDNFQSNLPWETQLSYGEMDSIVTAELRAQGITVEPMWSVVENGYLSTLTTEGFDPQLVKFNYVLAESFFGPTRQFLLYFPREGFFLAKRVYLSLLAALLFAAVILIAFFGVQRKGRRQKRLAAVKSDFINNMSHEFKTPLATINLAVDSLMKNGEKMNSEQMRSYFEIIKAENKRMNAQMESVLQMSMMDKEELTLDKEWMKLPISGGGRRSFPFECARPWRLDGPANGGGEL
ncbi:MAG: hypothetical protein EBY63_02905, partial [Flavobacteriia bacterium]|nr:hypothetical protein [Flavobacteriia bacterium]